MGTKIKNFWTHRLWLILDLQLGFQLPLTLTLNKIGGVFWGCFCSAL